MQSDKIWLWAGLWDGKLLSQHLRQRYGVELGVRQCQRVFRDMGFRFRKPRPQVATVRPGQSYGL